MKLSSFFKILNRKIERYERMTSNPFERPQPIVIIWVEDEVQGYEIKSDFEQGL